MTLPNGDRAVVDDEKITQYLLNFAHPVGGPKARLFKSLLGLELANWQELKHASLPRLVTAYIE